MSKKWRLIRLIETDGAMQMAIDEAILLNRSQNKVPNTLRFYTFQKPTISIGINQKIADFDFSAIKNKNFDLVRRITGGSAVLHYHDFTYAIIVSENDVPNQVEDAYRYLGGGLLTGLKLLNISAVFAQTAARGKGGICYLNFHPYDIVVNKQKISGNAQTRLKGVVLQHGTIICQNHLKELAECFKEKIDINDHQVTTLEQLQTKPIDFAEIEQKMIKGFSEYFKKEKITFKESELTAAEKKLAKELYETKYKQKDN